MPQLYDTNYLLGLEDTTIELEQNDLEKRIIKGEQWHVIHVTLSPKVHVCKACGCVDGIIKKYGIKTVKVKMQNTQGIKTMMLLKKQRYYCDECRSTFIGASLLRDPVSSKRH